MMDKVFYIFYNNLLNLHYLYKNIKYKNKKYKKNWMTKKFLKILDEIKKNIPA